MTIPGHRPYYRGSSCLCADCGLFLFDVRTGARLRALKDVDPVKLAAVERRFSFDPELAQRLVDEDPREVVSTYKFADKYNDFLKNPTARPDLQTPEAQEFLNKGLKEYHNGKTDPLTPWLTREWKKNRVRQHPELPYQLQFHGGPDYEYEDTVTGKPTSWHNFKPADLNHWADWYNSDHPSRQGKDIMQMKSPEMHQTIKDWDTDMRENAKAEAQIRGDIVHSYPDGWTVQQLTTPKELNDEGEAMGHCVGSYARPIENGESLIYSLRDHQNEPHATWEIRPGIYDQSHQCAGCGRVQRPYQGKDPCVDCGHIGDTVPAHGGIMEQIQGKGNKPPIPEYQKRIKDYFEKQMPHMVERPTWEPQHFDDPEYLLDPDDGGYVAYHPGDYGLENPETSYNWPRMIDYALGEAGGHSESPASELTQKAVEHGQFEPFAYEAQRQIDLGREQQRDRIQEEFDAWWEREGEPNAFEHGEYSYPDPDAFEDQETGKYDQHGFEQAEEEAQKRRDETQQWAYEEHKNNYHEPQPDMYNYMDELEVEINAQRLREKQAQENTEGGPPTVSKVSSKRPPHAHFSTGKPCYCTFNRVTPEWHTSAAPPRYLYHYSPPGNEESIAAQGLQTRHPETGESYAEETSDDDQWPGSTQPGVYMYGDDPSEPLSFAKETNPPGSVWKVDAQGLDIQPDPMHPDPNDNIWVHYDQIPPERLQRIAKIPVCEVCGDPLEHGQCKRCDWGGWSNAMGDGAMGDGDQNPTDPTREFHPSIQASNQKSL